MFPIQIPSMYVGDTDPNAVRAAQIAEMEAHVERVRQFACAVFTFVGHAYPGVPTEHIAKLTLTWETMQTAEIRERIAILKNAPPITPGLYQIVATPEMLADLFTQRDRIERQIEQLEKGLEKLAGADTGMDEIMRATTMPMLEQERARLTERIEQVQEQLDKQQPSREEPQK